MDVSIIHINNIIVMNLLNYTGMFLMRGNPRDLTWDCPLGALGKVAIVCHTHTIHQRQ